MTQTINNSEGQGMQPFPKCLPHFGLLHFTKSDLGKELKMNQKIGTIYVATNLQNGKRYVGQTIRKIQRRIYEHTIAKNNSPLSNAIKKYTTENFKWIFYSCSEGDLDWHETFLIKELNTLAPNGYNLDSGGNEQKYRHEETKQKMKENHWDCSGRNNPNYGKDRLETTKLKISEKNKGKNNGMYGKQQTILTRQKIKENNWMKGKTGINHPMFGKFDGKNNPFYGKRHTEETKFKMKLAWKRRRLGIIP